MEKGASGMRGGDTATGQRTTGRQRQAAARREQILKTALKLFAAQGFDATSTRQIAKEAGIAEGLIFHYFPTKASLLTALLENRRSFRSELRAILDGAEDRPAPEVLREVASGWLATLRRDAELVVLFITAQTNPEVNEAMQQVIGEGTSQVFGYLKARIDANELREDLPLQTAVSMFFSSLMIFFLTRRHLPEPEWVKQGDAYARELISVWLEGARR
jgi:AcrR family transcriptional regulator